MKVAIYTLGCKVNQYETQAMEQELRRRGHTVVDFSQEAEAYVVNTCSVTAVSDQKSRQVIHRARKLHPGAVVAVCGCYPQTQREDVEKLDVDLICGTGDRMGFLDLLEKTAAQRDRCCCVDRSFDRRTFEVLPAGGMEGRTRAMLKVEDGCVNFCTYCIIPYARGPVRSVPLEVAAEQARQLAEEGYREIVITGIEISSWGMERKDGKSLIDLMEAVAQAAGDVRIRLGSLEPRTITEEFCRRASALPGLCPQFHLSLQSGCDKTLRAMNRKYDTARYLQSVELLHRFFPRPAITTDLVVGFPGETDGDFEKTMDFIHRCGFAQMHVFPYSIRPGTPAADMIQVPPEVKDLRTHQVSRLAGKMHRAYLEGCLGRVYPVLFEQPREGLFAGHAPNYMEVRVTGEGLHNVIRPVRILRTDGEVLYGECEKE